MERKLLFRITAKDCRWDYYRGSGKGGQKKQKTSSAVRCFHEPSGSMGQSQDTRSKEQNKRLAFRRMSETKEFKNWIRLKAAKITGIADAAERYADEEIKSNRVLVDIRKNGRWVPEDLIESVVEIN